MWSRATDGAAVSGRHSLRRRLLWLILAAIALTSALQAATAYRTALRQADAMFDHNLQQIAHSIGAGVPVAPGDARFFDFSVQVWGPGGVQLFRSRGIELPSQPVIGFADATVDGRPFRIYVLRSADRTIQIAQDLDARRERARRLAWQALLPVALLAPLLMLAVWLLIKVSLAPVERLRHQLAGRPAEDLSALPEAGLPDEVAPLVHELNLLFGRVGEAFDSQRQFVADAAHELRSPLTALKLQAQALRREPPGPQRDAAIEALHTGVDRAIGLVTQLLALAREDARSPASDPREAIDLEELCRAAVTELLPQARARGIDVGLASAEPARLRGMSEPLRTLLRNLLGNAIKFTPPGGRVDIRIGHGARGPLLSVEDSGPGIPAAERERVFDRFYRTEGSGAPGSGLGLAIVRAVAARHGAQVRLSQSPTLGGLKAEVEFPATRADGLSEA